MFASPFPGPCETSANAVNRGRRFVTIAARRGSHCRCLVACYVLRYGQQCASAKYGRLVRVLCKFALVEPRTLIVGFAGVNARIVPSCDGPSTRGREQCRGGLTS